MTAHLLDTSALLAHYFAESGSIEVQRILADGHALLATPSLLEFRVRLRAHGVPEIAEADLQRYRRLIDAVLIIDDEVAQRAWDVRKAASARVPAADALIAGCAAHADATLVHRDAHFAAIPERTMAQRQLPREA